MANYLHTRNRLNAYRLMWLFVFFDLPVLSRTERKAAAKFRKDLLKDGFQMMQYSVYVRFCVSAEKADVHTRRVQRLLPKDGRVTIARITDKQYESMLNFWGRMPQKPEAQGYQQLELF
jgi:CRISPR-associated protein Cas2